MGIFERLRSGVGPAVSWQLYGGDEDLEVVGESAYQDALWSLCGGSRGDRVRHDVVAVLVPEPRNPYDSNAICVRVDAHVVGYLPREVAARYLSGLQALMSTSGTAVALRGVIVGGGYRNDGPGRLGVWLSHEPADFGIAVVRRVPGRPPTAGGEMRTGFSEAWQSDIEDDSYDLSWFDGLPTADRPAIAALRALLVDERDPIDRHFQFAELEKRLYHARDLYETALDEFDDACTRHDADMDVIRGAFMRKWGKVPLLETYRQMAIRKQKQKDWQACLWWADRGLALYGDDAARDEAVEDLLKRRNRALLKLEGRQR
ncbi:HIRAN domain-containing protein [Actinophytocola sp. NPDC049390]|uniref:HIRAN domain-containing protein n=1 Tax=Actinophytocola sp. NPDC049390 TaxID=3363894 RepID=UPI0037AC65BE